jgi:hypothetical protein
MKKYLAEMLGTFSACLHRLLGSVVLGNLGTAHACFGQALSAWLSASA